MAPGLTFDVLKRVGSPLAGARAPLLPPPRPLPSDGAPVGPLTSGGDGKRPPLEREAVEGVMAVQLKRERAKKKRAQLFPAGKASYFVVSDASKPVLEIYASEARQEMVFLLSLAGAEMSFEADNANIVMEKCFCVEVKTWKRKDAVFFKHQGFLFFEEDQARMLLWVKCIHSAIKKAAAGDSDAFRRTASGPAPPPVSPFRDYARLESDGGGGSSSSDDSDEAASGAPSRSLRAAGGPAPPPSDKVRLLQSLSIDPNCRAASDSAPASAPAASKREADDESDEESGSEGQAAAPTIVAREPRTPLNRFNSIFSGQRQGLPRFQRSPPGSGRAGLAAREFAKTLPASYLRPSKPPTIGARIASNLQSKLAESTAGWVPVASPSSSSQRLGDSPVAAAPDGPRRRRCADGEHAGSHPLSPATREPGHYAQLSTMCAEVSHALSPTRLLGGLRRPKQAVPGCASAPALEPPAVAADEAEGASEGESRSKSDARPPETRAEDLRRQQLRERNSSLALERFVVLAVASIAGAYRASLFLPLAVVGLAAHVFERDELFVEWACVSVGVFLASYCHALLGSCLIFACLFLWNYAEFQVRRRARRNAELRDDPADAHGRGETAHVALPNWMAYPDVDRVNWLNDVFATGWPYLKIAIRDSILGSLNPVLDAQRPAFISALSISKVELGDRPPQISGVKFVAANALTDEVTLDIALRVVADDSLAAELKLVSSLGAAATMALTDLFLVGTLRLTLNPLIGEWPCFSGLTLSFTSRPVFDFSLTAAKINLANVPFASEWLQSFLHDLLISYFVWPKVLHIPLWEDPPQPAAHHHDAIGDHNG